MATWLRSEFLGSGVAKEGRGKGRPPPPPNLHKNHSLKKPKSIEKLGGGDTRYILEVKTKSRSKTTTIYWKEA